MQRTVLFSLKSVYVVLCSLAQLDPQARWRLASTLSLRYKKPHSISIQSNITGSGPTASASSDYAYLLFTPGPRQPPSTTPWQSVRVILRLTPEPWQDVECYFSGKTTLARQRLSNHRGSLEFLLATAHLPLPDSPDFRQRDSRQEDRISSFTDVASCGYPFYASFKTTHYDSSGLTGNFLR
jgi:hypothetical protein